MNYDVIFEFEEKLADYTGAPYVVVTDCCTHAIELCMRLDNVKLSSFTAYTYLSIVQLMSNLGIYYTLTNESWIGEYRFHGTNIWDSARRLEPNMYQKGMKQCLSFGNGKPMSLGRCGAILLDNFEQYKTLSKMRSDGRDLKQSPWQEHAVISGFHYCPSLETCALGTKLLPTIDKSPEYHSYPDCRLVKIGTV